MGAMGFTAFTSWFVSCAKLPNEQAIRSAERRTQVRIGFILSDQPLNRLDDVLMRGSSFILAVCSSRWEKCTTPHTVAVPLALQGKPGSSLDVALPGRLNAGRKLN